MNPTFTEFLSVFWVSVKKTIQTFHFAEIVLLFWGLFICKWKRNWLVILSIDLSIDTSVGSIHQINRSLWHGRTVFNYSNLPVIALSIQQFNLNLNSFQFVFNLGNRETRLAVIFIPSSMWKIPIILIGLHILIFVCIVCVHTNIGQMILGGWNLNYQLTTRRQLWWSNLGFQICCPPKSDKIIWLSQRFIWFLSFRSTIFHRYQSFWENKR